MRMGMKKEGRERVVLHPAQEEAASESYWGMSKSNLDFTQVWSRVIGREKKRYKFSCSLHILWSQWCSGDASPVALFFSRLVSAFQSYPNVRSLISCVTWFDWKQKVNAALQSNCKRQIVGSVVCEDSIIHFINFSFRFYSLALSSLTHSYVNFTWIPNKKSASNRWAECEKETHAQINKSTELQFSIRM